MKLKGRSNYLWDNSNVGTFYSTGIADRSRELGVAHPQHCLALRHVGLQEELQVITDNALAYRVNVGQSIPSGFEWVETNQIDNLG